MKINWKLRFKNKATLSALIVAFVALGYQILGLFNIVPGISESQLVEIIGAVINILVILGIINDPTTSGITDSRRALTYDKPNDEK